MILNVPIEIWLAVAFVGFVVLTWRTGIDSIWSLFGIIGACFAGVGLLLVPVFRNGCDRFAEANRLEYQFTLTAGCLVEVQPGLWLDKDSVHFTNGELVFRPAE